MASGGAVWYHLVIYGGEKFVSKMLVNSDGFETEPSETRTRNLLIKRDDPRMLLNNSKGDLGSNNQKFSPEYYVVYYLIPYGVVKFVGKNTAIN